MADHRYGYFGEVSYRGQNRFRPYYAGTNGLGTISAIPSGSYRAAPGRLVHRAQAPSRQNDIALFAGLGTTLAGPRMYGLGATDREICATLTQVGGGLVRDVGGAAIGQRPVRRAGESDAAFNARTADWELQQRITSTGGNTLATASALCNLIQEGQQQIPGQSPPAQSDWQIAQARAELERLYALQQQQAGAAGVSTNTLLMIGGALAIAAAGYFLLKG